MSSDRIRKLAIGVTISLIIAGLIVAFFNRLAGGNLLLARGDAFLYFYPYWHGAAEALRSARVPLWNPDLFMGVPFLANSQVGFFYPLNWPVWLLLSAPYAVSVSTILHLFIAGTGTYLLGRRCLSLSRSAAILGATLFALGGYLTAQVEHVNQVQGIAWLPWYFVILCPWQASAKMIGDSVRLTAGIAAVTSLQLLSGHTQTVFISLVAVVMWLVYSYFNERDVVLESLSRRQYLTREARRALRFAVPFVAGIFLAICISAIQLIPTLELSGLSLRQGGLPINEVLSFSLQPLLLGQSLLPAYDNLVFSEYVAFVPITALLLAAIGSGRMWAKRQARPFLILAIIGLLLALGRFNPIYYLLAHLPVFDLFRAPARWSVLYALGIALLAAVGWQRIRDRTRGQASQEMETKDGQLPSVIGVAMVIVLVVWSILSVFLADVVPVAPEAIVKRPSSATIVAWLAELLAASMLILWFRRGRMSRFAAWALIIGTIAVLFISTRILPYNHPTTPNAFFEQRPPVSYMLAAKACQLPDESCDSEAGRVLGLSKIFFDLGDQNELDGIYGNVLGDQERFDYIVASKQKEILGPNLPLLYGLRSVDGFDGGVLPLESYAQMMGVVLPSGTQTFDGRLREHLDAIPEERWLDHFGAKYIITDKVGDQWRQDVFFDMKHPVMISDDSGPITVGYLPEYQATDIYLVANGVPGTLSLKSNDGRYWMLEPQQLEPDFWRVPFPEPSLPDQIVLYPCDDDGAEDSCGDGWHVKSLALVDARDNSFMPLIAGAYRLIYSGDVKIYENLDVLPLATLIYNWHFTDNPQDGVTIMTDEGFDPAEEAIVRGGGPEAPGAGKGRAVVMSNKPEYLKVRVETDRPALLLVRESFYPGWKATIDGTEARIVKADVLFRGVFVPKGDHTIELAFTPQSYQAGALLSVLGLLTWLVLIVYGFLVPFLELRREGRSSPVIRNH